MKPMNMFNLHFSFYVIFGFGGKNLEPNSSSTLLGDCEWEYNSAPFRIIKFKFKFKFGTPKSLFLYLQFAVYWFPRSKEPHNFIHRTAITDNFSRGNLLFLVPFAPFTQSEFPLGEDSVISGIIIAVKLLGL